MPNHTLPQHAGETPALPGFSREAETASEESLGKRVFAAGLKGLFRADPPSTCAQKRPKGPQGRPACAACLRVARKQVPGTANRNACFHRRDNSRKSSPRAAQAGALLFGPFSWAIKKKAQKEGRGGIADDGNRAKITGRSQGSPLQRSSLPVSIPQQAHALPGVLLKTRSACRPALRADRPGPTARYRQN